LNDAFAAGARLLSGRRGARGIYEAEQREFCTRYDTVVHETYVGLSSMVPSTVVRRQRDISRQWSPNRKPASELSFEICQVPTVRIT
jgi:hypothetical protein